MENSSIKTYVYEYVNPTTGKVVRQVKRYTPRVSHKKERAEMIQLLKSIPMNSKYMEFYNAFKHLVENQNKINNII
jgi:hypothetical protein